MYQAWPGLLLIEGDSDAGDVATRCSCGGGFESTGAHVVDAWAVQHQHSLSSGEAEYNLLVNGSARGISSKNLFAELKLPVGVARAYRELSRCGCGSVASRLGAGKIRLLAVCLSQLHDAVRKTSALRELQRSYRQSRQHDDAAGSCEIRDAPDTPMRKPRSKGETASHISAGHWRVCPRRMSLHGRVQTPTACVVEEEFVLWASLTETMIATILGQSMTKHWRQRCVERA